MTTDPVAPQPVIAWHNRVLKVGGLIQLAFAAFWLVRGGLNIRGGAGQVLVGVFTLLVVTVVVYAVRVSAGLGSRPTGRAAQRIERSVSIATVIELAASFGFPVIVIAAGRSDWVLPSIAITIGPLLLWLDHEVRIPRLRPVGWVLTIGPFLLVALMSGRPLAAGTGIAAGVLLLGTATAGFRELDRLRAPPATTPVPAPRTATVE